MCIRENGKCPHCHGIVDLWQYGPTHSHAILHTCTVRKIVVNVIHNVHNVYILSTQGWERNMQGDSGWGLSRLLSHKRSCNQESRFDYWYLNFYNAWSVYCNTTKRIRVQRNCDYAYLCVYSTHIWHLKCSGHGCQYIFHLTILVVDWFSAISDKCRCRLWNHLCRVVVINLGKVFI